MSTKKSNPGFLAISWLLSKQILISFLILLGCLMISAMILSAAMPEIHGSRLLVPVFLTGITLSLLAAYAEGRFRRKYSGRTLLAINLSAEANDVLEKLAARSGGDKADVLRKSLGLMELAMQAHEQGRAVGIAERPDVLETEFTGF